MNKKSDSWLARHRGGASLMVATGGWLAVTAALHSGNAGHTGLILLRHVFEGAVAGGFADWFAVRALFREVPIPFLRRHTNLIVKSRPRLTEGIVDMIQHRWLAPDVIRERLQTVSLSQMVVDQLSHESVRRKLTGHAAEFFARIAAWLDDPVLVRSLAELLRERLNSTSIVDGVLGEIAHLASDEEIVQSLWNAGIDMSIRFLNDEQARRLIYRFVDQQIDQYKEEGHEKSWLKGVWRDLKVWAAVPDKGERDALVARRIDGIIEALDEARHAKGEAMREMLQRRLIDTATAFREADSPIRQLVARHINELASRLHQSGMIHRLLGQTKAELIRSLETEDSSMRQWLDGLSSDALEKLRNDAALRKHLDELVADLLCGFISRHPDLIGDTVRHGLSEARISNEALTSQIDEKIGGELEWIRVNGAVVGGIVAGVLGLVQLAGW